MEESQRTQAERLEVQVWGARLESHVSPGLAPPPDAIGRCSRMFDGSVCPLDIDLADLTPDTTTTSDLSASATKAADWHVGAGHWLLLQSSALTTEDGLDFLGV